VEDVVRLRLLFLVFYKKTNEDSSKNDYFIFLEKGMKKLNLG
jgi:hypothetical protein